MDCPFSQLARIFIHKIHNMGKCVPYLLTGCSFFHLPPLQKSKYSVKPVDGKPISSHKLAPLPPQAIRRHSTSFPAGAAPSTCVTHGGVRRARPAWRKGAPLHVVRGGWPRHNPRIQRSTDRCQSQHLVFYELNHFCTNKLFHQNWNKCKGPLRLNMKKRTED